MIDLEPKINWIPFDKDNPPEHLFPDEEFLVFLREDDYDDGKTWTYHVDIAEPYGAYIDNFWSTRNDWVEGQRVEVLAYASLPYGLKEEDLVDPSCVVEDPTRKALKNFNNMCKSFLDTV